MSTWYSNNLACVICNSVTDLCTKTLMKKKGILQLCTPWNFLSLLPHALLPNTAALTSSIGFTVRNYQAVPKANQMSAPTSNMSWWPSHIFRSPYRFNQLSIAKRHALLLFWFQKPSTSTGLHDPLRRLVMECLATNCNASRYCLVPGIEKGAPGQT